MIRRTFLTLFFALVYFIPAEAKLDIVYPSSPEVTVNSPITFISGSSDVNSNVTMNSEPVRLWDDGIFVHVIPLNYGVNTVNIQSVHNGITEKKVLKIKRNKLSDKISVKQVPYIKNETGILTAETIKDRATVRSKPSGASSRIIDLPKGIILYLDGYQGDYYKIKEFGNNEFWIHKINISLPQIVSGKNNIKLYSHDCYSDKNYEYHKFSLSQKVLYTIVQEGNKLRLTLYGVKNNENNCNNFDYTFNYSGEILGYDGYYDKDGNFIFRYAKEPKDIDISHPLRNINIFIDAGHGGKDKGTIGPGRIYEKDINLDIASDLIKMLKDAGANVSYSRDNDSSVDLYKRTDISKNNNALISISIHCNSLPYGKNPYNYHGVEVHYYNDNAKMLAQIIKDNLANDLSIRDNGIHKSSFALVRPTNPVSVLIETAYMIYPEEYILLKNKYFRRNAAKSIKKSIEEYILYLNNQNL